MSVDGVNPDRIRADDGEAPRQGRTGPAAERDAYREPVSLMNFAGGSLISFAGSLCAPGAPFGQAMAMLSG